MSIYVRINSKNRGRRRISKLVDYIFDRTKTKDEFCHTLGVGKETVYQDMLFVKKLYCKTEGRQVLHWVLSHDEDVPTEVAELVACEVLHLLNGEYQAIAATHTNTRNRHTHFAINTVSVRTGKKFSESVKDMLIFREKVNVILKKHGLSQIGKIESLDEEEWEKYEYEYEAYEYLEEDENESFSFYYAEDDVIWHGVAAVREERILTPGVYYEMPSVPQHDFTIVQKDDGKEFLGYGDMVDGRLFISGILYEKES